MKNFLTSEGVPSLLTSIFIQDLTLRGYLFSFIDAALHFVNGELFLKYKFLIRIGVCTGTRERKVSTQHAVHTSFFVYDLLFLSEKLTCGSSFRNSLLILMDTSKFQGP
jgi:hypothetical protein